MTPVVLPELLVAAQARHHEARDLIATFARQETPTGDLAALDDFARSLAERYRGLGAHTRLIDTAGGAVLVADFPGRGERADSRPVLLLGHHDTVHAPGSVSVHETDGQLHGPGVYDMKGGLVVAESAIEILAELGWDQRPVRLVLTPDEEIGSPASSDSVVANAEGVEYALGLEPPHADGSLKTSRHGSTRVRIFVEGRAAHAALAPHEGINAIDELCDQLALVRELTRTLPDVLLNVGAITGGGRTNVVPDRAHADIGLRFRTVEDETAVLGLLARLEPVRAGALVDALVLTSRPVWAASSASTDLLDAVVASGAEAGVAVAGAPSTGAADTNLVGALGLPTLDGFGPLGDGAHALDEHVRLDALASRIALLAGVLHRV